jgi:hypothetical protein
LENPPIANNLEKSTHVVKCTLVKALLNLSLFIKKGRSQKKPEMSGFGHCECILFMKVWKNCQSLASSRRETQHMLMDSFGGGFFT